MPLRNAMWVNDYDLSGVGFVLEQVDGHEDGLTAQDRTMRLPQRVGAVPLALEAETAPREIEVRGLIEGGSMAGVRTKLDALKSRLFNGAVEVRFANNPERMYLARCMGKQFLATPPQFANPKSRVSFRLLCPDPLAYTKLGVAIGFSNTKQPCPLGSAVSFPVLRIAGAVTNPVLTYRDVRGVAKKTMGFTVTLAANEYLEIDSERADILRVTAGVAAGGMALWTSGTFFDGLDPQDADVANGQWPTLEVSPAASGEALYRKAWL